VKRVRQWTAGHVTARCGGGRGVSPRQPPSESASSHAAGRVFFALAERLLCAREPLARPSRAPREPLASPLPPQHTPLRTRFFALASSHPLLRTRFFAPASSRSRLFALASLAPPRSPAHLAGLLRVLRNPAEARAAVPRQPLQVDPAERLDRPRLAGPRPAPDHDQLGRTGSEGALQLVDQEPPHGLEPALHERVAGARLALDPALRGRGAQAAAEAAQVALGGVVAAEGGPALEARGSGRAADELVAQDDGRLLPALLVARAHEVPLGVGEDGAVEGAGQGALRELERGAHVQQRRRGEDQGAVVRRVRTESRGGGGQAGGRAGSDSDVKQSQETHDHRDQL
jgi:hypothetical protein